MAKQKSYKVLDFDRSPKLSEPINAPINIGESTHEITGKVEYNTNTKRGSVTVKLNLSLLTVEPNQQDDCVKMVERVVREEFFGRLLHWRTEHHRHEAGAAATSGIFEDDAREALQQERPKPGRPKKNKDDASPEPQKAKLKTV